MNKIKNTQASKEIFRNFLSRRKMMLLALFIIFLSLRVFVDTNQILLGSDNLKYLHASETFPEHKMYNDQLYLLHPPMFPYIIYFVNLFVGESYKAAMVVSMISAIVTFFLLYMFFMMVTENFFVSYLVLIFYSLSVAFISAAHSILKESFVVMLIIAALYFYVAGLKTGSKKYFLFSSLAGAVLGFAADHALFVLPALAVSYLIFNKTGFSFKCLRAGAIKYAALPIVVTLASYSIWLLIKYLQYSSAIYFPNGVEGTPVSTESLNLLKVVSPTQFEDFNAPFVATGALSLAKRAAFQFGYMLNIEPFSIPRGINLSTAGFLLKPFHIAYMALLYLPLALAALYGLIRVLFELAGKKIHNNHNLYFIILFIIFLVPLIQPFASPRFIYTSYLFLFYFLSYGIYTLLSRKNPILPSKILLALVIVLLLAVPYWHYRHPYFFYSINASVASQKTGDFINQNLEKDATIIAQPGYGVKIIYLTNRKTIGLHPNPEQFLKHIAFYGADYVVFGKKYTTDFYHYSLDTIGYIENSPSQFRLVANISEDYSNFYVEGDPARTDQVLIYKILHE